MKPLPAHYFRLRDNGALVFRLGGEDRNRRLEMEPIAQVSLKSGEIRPQGGRELGAEDRAAIEAWLERRREIVATREAAGLAEAAETLSRLAHDVQSRATPAEVAAVADEILLAMHDLRGVLLRKMSEAGGETED